MKIYTVGGAVRDALLGLAVKDRDYVVVGATPQHLLALGYTPVGKDFPVFLHPHTHEEYALARTERKTAPGYQGFVFHADAEVTLAQDLIRRDLTINAMARAQDGSLIDPFGGVNDLRARVFRHVSAAFSEDPVRILRVARFAARFADFSVAPETEALMRHMVEAGEADALVAERVWQELARGLMEAQPSRMVAVLRDCGALARLLPEIDALWHTTQPGSAINAGQLAMSALDSVAAQYHPLQLRFAVLTHAVGNTAEPAALATLCRRLKIPNDCRDLALMTAREYRNLALGKTESQVQNPAQNPEATLGLLQRCDAFRKPQRFHEMLIASECIAQSVALCEAALNQRVPLPASSPASSPTTASTITAQTAYWRRALQAAQGVDGGKIAAETAATKPKHAEAISRAIHAARRAALEDLPSG